VSVLEKILEVKKKEVEKCKQLVPVEKMKKLGFVAKQTGSLKFSFEELQVITGWKK